MNTGHRHSIIGMSLMLLLQGAALKSHGESNTLPSGAPALRGGVQLQTPEGPEKQVRHKAFDQVDTDRDGKLSFAEFCELERLKNLDVDKQRKLFDFLDRNRDGSVHAHELHPVRPKWTMIARRELRRFDQNNDAQLDAAEFSALMKYLGKHGDFQRQRFMQLDQNKDQVIDIEELGRRPDSKHGEIIFNLYDKDASGGLDYPEYSMIPMVQRWPEERRQKLFGLIDFDGDGKISRAEVGALYKHRRQSQKLPPHGGR
ncbi:MAG: EF-hand domain-containing protein [Akkermansiaceae bacterium]